MIYYIFVLTPVVGLIFNTAIQISVCRYFKRKGLLNSIFIGFCGGLGYIFFIEIWYDLLIENYSAEIFFHLLLNTITYVALSYCYFHFLNLGETARRIRILREIWESGKALSYDEITRQYGAKEIINVRLKRMLNNDQLIDRNDRYYIRKPQLLFMAKIIVVMKIILLKKPSEFG